MLRISVVLPWCKVYSLARKDHAPGRRPFLNTLMVNNLSPEGASFVKVPSFEDMLARSTIHTGKEDDTDGYKGWVEKCECHRPALTSGV